LCEINKNVGFIGAP